MNIEIPIDDGTMILNKQNVSAVTIEYDNGTPNTCSYYDVTVFLSSGDRVNGQIDATGWSKQKRTQRLNVLIDLLT